MKKLLINTQLTFTVGKLPSPQCVLANVLILAFEPMLCRAVVVDTGAIGYP